LASFGSRYLLPLPEVKSTEQLEALGMSKRRVLLLNSVIAALFIGSLFCLVFEKSYWPFLEYPMFSEVERKYSLSDWRLYGVTQEQPHNEIPLLASDYIQPFDQSPLGTALKKMKSNHNPESSQKLLNRALLDCLERYEKLRLAGRHDGPPLQGVRLYKVRWHLDAWAENVDRPDRRKLIAQVDQQSGD
jgi:hypothetical protein